MKMERRTVAIRIVWLPIVISCGVLMVLLLSEKVETQGLSGDQREPLPSECKGTRLGKPSANQKPTDDAGLTPSVCSHKSADSHSLAISDLVARANANEQLAPIDIQSLLAFISSPKPGELTDGEWEERVNGVLNLLRRQEVSSFQFQVLSGEGAGSLAGSGAGSQGAAGPDFAKATPDKPPRPTVPGLTEVLVEMAEKNGSKVLRLYAMQHLSLWFGKERDPAKRRAMVGLLEKLATTPGDDTAGCAVLMLADVRRQVSSFKWGGE